MVSGLCIIHEEVSATNLGGDIHSTEQSRDSTRRVGNACTSGSGL